MSFRRAGEALRTAQPSLSQQIRCLEAELGVQLFERSRRRIRLTNAGMELLAGARPVIERFDTCAQRAREAQTVSRGRLDVGTNGMVMIDHLPRVVRAFRSTHPLVDVRLTVLRAPELRGAVRDGRIQIAFTTDDVADERLDGTALWGIAQQVVLPSNHPLAERASIELRDLRDDLLITHPNRGVGGHSSVMALCYEQRFVPSRILNVPGVADYESLVGLVACGYGFTILPAPYVHLAPRSVVFKEITGPTPLLRIMARWRAGDADPLLAHFLVVARSDAARSTANGRPS